MDEPSDEALMARICEGDNEALGLLFRRYGRTVRRIAFRVLRDWSEADDLLQDIFISIYRLCRTYDSSKSPVRFWISRMTFCRAVSRKRYLSSRHFYTRLDIDRDASHLADSQTHTHQLDEFIDTNLNNGSLARLFAELSENQRQTLRLYFVDGYTLEEIAAKLGSEAISRITIFEVWTSCVDSCLLPKHREVQEVERFFHFSAERGAPPKCS
jgi:RNA polymerase sigma-70 factor (ECF subfamily)